jgi:hypothetical protein
MRPCVPLLVSCVLGLVACSKPSDDKATTQTSNATAPAATAATTAAAAAPTAAPAPSPAPAPAAAVDVIPNMKAFMGMLDGKDDSAGKALKKFAVPAKQKDDLGMYTLTDPKVTASDKSGANTCYTMESTAGVMKHTSHLCWNPAGKITDITDKSE